MTEVISGHRLLGPPEGMRRVRSMAPPSEFVIADLYSLSSLADIGMSAFSSHRHKTFEQHAPEEPPRPGPPPVIHSAAPQQGARENGQQANGAPRREPYTNFHSACIRTSTANFEAPARAFELTSKNTTEIPGAGIMFELHNTGRPYVPNRIERRAPNCAGVARGIWSVTGLSPGTRAGVACLYSI